MSMPKYHIITYGCQMNKADSERIATGLEKRGYKPATSAKEADLVVVNMCSVRQSAVDRVFGMPMKLRGVKAKKVLTGCVLKKDRKKFEMLFDEIWDSRSLAKIMPGCKGAGKLSNLNQPIVAKFNFFIINLLSFGFNL